MNLRQQLDYLFNPRSVAVVGASSTFGKWGFNLFNRVLSSKDKRETAAKVLAHLVEYSEYVGISKRNV